MRHILLLISLLLLNGCALLEASQPWHPPLVIPADTATGQPTTVLFGGNVKFKGPVTFTVQQGSDNVATPTTADNRNAGRGSAVVTGPAAKAAATTRTGIPPWALVAGAVVLVVTSLLALAYQYRTKLAGLFIPHP